MQSSGFHRYPFPDVDSAVSDLRNSGPSSIRDSDMLNIVGLNHVGIRIADKLRSLRLVGATLSPGRGGRCTER